MIPVRWLEIDAREVPASDDWLASEERGRLAAMRFERRRRDWRLGRWAAKRVLTAPGAGASPLAASPAELAIRNDAEGAPQVWRAEHDERVPCTLSLSHRAERAVCAVGPPRILLGCDLELVEGRSETFVEQYFTESEVAWMERAGRTRALYASVVWSAKESALKALGCGLRMDTRDLEVSLVGGTPVDGWRPLGVRALRRLPVSLMLGWWRRREDRVVTLVASPRPDVPASLAVADLSRAA